MKVELRHTNNHPSIIFSELFLQCLTDYCCFLQCLKYQTDQLQDVKKLEKLSSSLMRNMVSKER